MVACGNERENRREAVLRFVKHSRQPLIFCATFLTNNALAYARVTVVTPGASFAIQGQNVEAHRVIGEIRFAFSAAVLLKRFLQLLHVFNFPDVCIHVKFPFQAG